MKKGFTLIECMIYCALSLTLTLLATRFVAVVQPRIKNLSNLIDQVVQQYAALDFFAREVQMAPACVRQWKKTAQHELIWATKRGDIGWIFESEHESGRLYRAVGTFDRNSDKWLHQQRWLVADRLSHAAFTAHIRTDDAQAEPYVDCVTLTLGQFELIMSPKNRGCL